MDVVVSPAIVAFNAHSGGHPQAVLPGQTLEALVLQLIDAATVRVSVAGTVVDLPTQIPLVPGAVVRLAVRGHGTDTKFVIVGTSPRHSAEAAERAANSLTATPAGLAGQSAAATAPAATGAPDTADHPAVNGAAASAGDEAAIAGTTEHAPPPANAGDPRSATSSNPTVALAAAIRSAAPRQVGLAPLLADAREMVAAPQLPPPVRQALVKLLSMALPFDQAVSPEQIKQGLNRSGIFLEAHLAEANASALPSAGTDVKAALVTLRHALSEWTVPRLPLPPSRPGTALPEGEPAVAHAAAVSNAPALPGEIKAPPPPYRGAPTTGQAPVAASIDGHEAMPVVRDVLLERTDGALARVTLLQSASLPDGMQPQHRPETSGPHWNFEVPFVAAQGAGVAHFEIARDGHRAAPEAPAPTWRATFSLDLEPMGPVHAQISVSGQRAAVRLWAERRATAAALRTGAAELTRALHDAALETSEVLVRDGVPPRPVKTAPAGRFLDRAT